MPRPQRQEPEAVSGTEAEARRELRDQLAAHKRRKGTNRPRASYDIPPAMIAAIQQAAEREQVAQSDIVAFALAQWLDRYLAGGEDLAEHKIASRNLRYSLSLELPTKWQRSR